MGKTFSLPYHLSFGHKRFPNQNKNLCFASWRPHHCPSLPLSYDSDLFRTTNGALPFSENFRRVARTFINSDRIKVEQLRTMATIHVLLRNWLCFFPLTLNRQQEMDTHTLLGTYTFNKTPFIFGLPLCPLYNLLLPWTLNPTIINQL